MMGTKGDVRMTLGEVVKRWRLARGWEQKDVVARSRPRIGQSTVSYIEAGRLPRPSGRTLAGLATAFGVTVDELLAAVATADGAALPPAGPVVVELPAGLDPGWVQDLADYGPRLTDRHRRALLRLARELAGEPPAKMPEEPGEEGIGDQGRASGA